MNVRSASLAVKWSFSGRLTGFHWHAFSFSFQMIARRWDQTVVRIKSQTVLGEGEMFFFSFYSASRTLSWKLVPSSFSVHSDERLSRTNVSTYLLGTTPDTQKRRIIVGFKFQFCVTKVFLFADTNCEKKSWNSKLTIISKVFWPWTFDKISFFPFLTFFCRERKKTKLRRNSPRFVSTSLFFKACVSSRSEKSVVLFMGKKHWNVYTNLVTAMKHLKFGMFCID